MMALAVLPLSSSPEGLFALDCPLGQGQSHVYMYILSASIQLLHLLQPTGQGRRKAMPKRACPCPIVLHPSLPRPPGLCVIPSPQTQGTRGRKAGVGFALFCSLDSTSLLHHFLPVPVGVQGLRERTDLCSYFSYTPCSEWVGMSPLTLTIPSFTPCLGESLCMFSSLWWEMFD